MSTQHSAGALEAALRAELAGQHFAVTDVSSNYTILNLSGPRVRELLAQGCPLDLHPRAFRPGQSAGSVFFKASIWLWQTEKAPVYEVLVRNSFCAYVWLMLEQCTAESGLVKRVFEKRPRREALAPTSSPAKAAVQSPTPAACLS